MHGFPGFSPYTWSPVATRPPTVTARQRFEALLATLQQKQPALVPDRLRSVFDRVSVFYEGRAHWTGESLLDHCLGVLERFAAFSPDEDSVIACLTHHLLLEEGQEGWTLEEVEAAFGKEAAGVLGDLRLLSRITMKNKRLGVESLRLMFLRVAHDERALILALCHQEYVLDFLPSMPPEDQRALSQDVLSLFAPVAARMGIYSLKHRLESKAFPVMYPVDSERIAEQLHQLHEKHGDFLNHAVRSLSNFLEKEGMPVRIEVREKHPYSIFQKMKNKTISHVEDLYDLFAFRVIVRDEAECYQTLGLLHRIGRPIAHRFKDYIAFPKPNGYKSLHTTLANLPGMPGNIMAEVQIRTETMHREAKFGVAAHWSYKEGGDVQQTLRRSRLQHAFSAETQEDVPMPAPLSDHIFVLTPRGDIIELPEHATPLDFAFHVHTDVGLTFRAARVNGSIVPMDYQLENGDIVEVIRSGDARPSPRWMTLLKTASARNRLKKFLSTKDRPLMVARGKDLLNKELIRRRLAPLDISLTILRDVEGQRLTLHDREDLLAKVGQGALTIQALLPRIDALGIEAPAKKAVPSSQPVDEASVARVEGSTPMPTRFAKCCKADELRTEKLVGVIGRDGEVRIHGAHCILLKHVNPERIIGVTWIVPETKKKTKLSKRIKNAALALARGKR